MKKGLFSFFVLLAITAHAQYTDIINSNKPGRSMGAYSVGQKVAQAEADVYYETNKHEALNLSQENIGLNYMVRYGVWRNEFEIIGDGTFLYSNRTADGLSSSKLGFQHNTIGAKYLFYDPVFLSKSNVYSWKANADFSWRKMIPAISLYLGFNILEKNRYLYELNNEDYKIITPKAIIALQSHPLNEVALVLNLVGNNMASKHAQYNYIFTLTHNLYDDRWSIFLESEGITSDYYKDSLLRMGASYLIDENFQINASIGASWKTTPTRYLGGIGVSYRFYDRYKDIEYIEKKKAREKQNKEDAQIFGF